MEIIMPKMANYVTVCHSDACENQFLKIEATATEENPLIFCGVCQKQITDITKKK